MMINQQYIYIYIHIHTWNYGYPIFGQTQAINIKPLSIGETRPHGVDMK